MICAWSVATKSKSVGIIMTEDKIRFSDLGLVRFVNHNWDLILCFGILLVVIHLW